MCSILHTRGEVICVIPQLRGEQEARRVSPAGSWPWWVATLQPDYAW